MSDQQTPETASDTPAAPTTTPEPVAPASTTDHADSNREDYKRIKRTRAATAWVTVVALFLISIALVVFILQNSQSVQIDFLWMSGDIAAAAALLVAAVAGALLVAIPAAVRITQLRNLLRRHAKSGA